MLKRLLGDPNARKLKRYAPIVSDINILEEDYVSLSDDELRTQVTEFRSKIEKASESLKNNNAHTYQFLEETSCTEEQLHISKIEARKI